ncbi:MAG: hypothetical protein K1X89_00115 [Myxococcaceae bacterium]|nr:hypothetical protein [Myxococcaceae bacterium]
MSLANRLTVGVVLALTLAGCNCGGKLRALEAALTVEPANVDFGEVPEGQTATAMVQLSNNGSLDLTLATPLIQNSRQAFAVESFPKSLPVGAKGTLVLRYTAPLAGGPDVGALLISSETVDGTVAVGLRGTSVLGPRPDGGTDGGLDGGLDGGADGGPPDSGSADAGQDAGPGDAGALDGGVDGGPLDAGAGDAGLDAGQGWPLDGGNSTCPGASDVYELDLALTDAGISQQPRLTLLPGGYAMVWTDGDLAGTTSTVEVALLDPYGKPLGPRQQLMGATGFMPPRQDAPVLAFNGTAFGAVHDDVWGSTRNTYFATLDLQFKVTGSSAPHGQPLGNQSYVPRWPELVWNPLDKQWAAFWHEIGTGSPFGLYLERLTAAGDFSFATRGPVCQANTATFNGPSYGNLAGGERAAWNGNGYTFVYVENRSDGVALTRLDRDGGFVSHSTTGTVAEVFPSASLAQSPAGYGVAWSEWPNDGGPGSNGMDVRFSLADPNGTFQGSPLTLTQSGGYCTYLASGFSTACPYVGVVWTGTNYLLTWVQLDGAITQLWTTRVDVQGNEVAGARRKLTCGTTKSLDPSPLWNGSFAAVPFVREGPGGKQALKLLLFR